MKRVIDLSPTCSEGASEKAVVPKAAPVPVFRSPIESIRGVYFFVWRKRGFRFSTTSLPGHLIHFIVQGRVHQSCNGRVYDLGPGDAIWYFENEWVEGEMREVPCVYYSVNFLAPSLPVPDEARRVIRPRNKQMLQQFQLLRQTWKSPRGRMRDFLCHSHLLALLAEINRQPSHEPQRAGTSGMEAQLWWDVEVKVRAALDQPYRLASLAALSGRSPATLSLACRAATGEPPMRRIKHIRLSLAHGMVLHSELRISEIARRVGYERLNEFSRDYHSHFDVSPRQNRSGVPSRTWL